MVSLSIECRPLHLHGCPVLGCRDSLAQAASCQVLQPPDPRGSEPGISPPHGAATTTHRGLPATPKGLQTPTAECTAQLGGEWAWGCLLQDSLGPASQAAARHHPRCSGAHALWGQRLVAEWGPPFPSDSIQSLPKCSAKRHIWLWERGWVGGQAIPRGLGVSRRQVQAPYLCPMYFVPPGFTKKPQITPKIMNNSGRAIAELNQCGCFWVWDLMLTARLLGTWNRIYWYLTVNRSFCALKKSAASLAKSHHSFFFFF